MQKLGDKFNKIAVKKGECFAVELTAAGGTGYSWDLQVTSGKATVVKRESEAVGAPGPHGEMLCGGPVLDRTILRAEEAGTIELTAALRRPWESGKAPAKLRAFKVTVE